MPKKSKKQLLREELAEKNVVIETLAAVNLGDREVRIQIVSFDEGTHKLATVERKPLKNGGHSERQLNRIPCGYFANAEFRAAYTMAAVRAGKHAEQQEAIAKAS